MVSSRAVPMTDTYGLTIANGYVWIDGEKETFCLRLEDGQKAASVAGVGGARTQVAFYADGRLFIHPRAGTAARASTMLRADARTSAAWARRLRRRQASLAGQWHPPHPHDTAYANQPVIYRSSTPPVRARSRRAVLL